MDSQEALSRIIHIEENFDVNEIAYLKTQSWPYYRSILYDLFLNSKLTKGKDKKSSNYKYSFPKHKKQELPRSTLSKVEEIAQKTSESIGTSDIFFLCDSKFQIIYNKSSYTHKFFTPIYKAISNDYKCTFLLSNPWVNEKRKPVNRPSERSYTIDQEMHWVSLLRSNIPLDSSHKLFFDFINKEFPEYHFEYSEIERVLQFICLVGCYFKVLLETCNAKLSLSSVIPHIRTFALTLGSRLAGVPSVDVQHGHGGETHPIYNNWTSIPLNGYQLLPKYYWCWGEGAKSRILDWTKSNRFHQAFIGGNPWISSLIEPLEEKERSPATRGGSILISLQNYDIPQFLLHAIKHFKDYNWRFLCHPLHNHLFEKYHLYLTDNLKGFNNWEILKSTKNEFYSFIKEASLHITGWSSTAHEALSFGVQTILIHKNSLFELGLDINRGIFRYADNFSDLKKIIEERNFTKEKNPFMEPASLGMKEINTIISQGNKEKV
ncbi:MAG: hypothetical protein HOI70_04385 [Opitutae bacterium]|nr:hypothetical protein [Opitutae bacterium]